MVEAPSVEPGRRSPGAYPAVADVRWSIWEFDRSTGHYDQRGTDEARRVGRDLATGPPGECSGRPGCITRSSLARWSRRRPPASTPSMCSHDAGTCSSPTLWLTGVANQTDSGFLPANGVDSPASSSSRSSTVLATWDRLSHKTGHRKVLGVTPHAESVGWCSTSASTVRTCHCRNAHR
jgi:hypothetical protein